MSICQTLLNPMEVKMRRPLAIMTVVLFVCFPMTSFAEWVLYDNFNSGVINPNKWDQDISGLADPIVVENGAAKFVQDLGIINDSSWLGFKKSPEKIKAVRARVKIASNQINVFCRIGGYIGEDEDGNPLWSQIRLRSYKNDTDDFYQAVEFTASYMDANDTNVTLHDLATGGFKKPLSGTYEVPDDLTGEWVTLEIHFNRKALTYGVVNMNNWITSSISDEEVKKTTNPDFIFKGIGVRAVNTAVPGQTCTVYFDSVWVLY